MINKIKVTPSPVTSGSPGATLAGYLFFPARVGQNRAKHDPTAQTLTNLVLLSEAKDPLLPLADTGCRFLGSISTRGGKLRHESSRPAELWKRPAGSARKHSPRLPEITGQERTMEACGPPSSRPRPRKGPRPLFVFPQISLREISAPLPRLADCERRR
jgi:hypothetical protein